MNALNRQDILKIIFKAIQVINNFKDKLYNSFRIKALKLQPLLLV